MPMAYTMKFIIMVWATFLARVKPVSARANPACMNMTRKPVMSAHMMLMDTLLWPTASATSTSVGLPASFAGTSAMPPVAVPLGSGLAGGGAGAAAAGSAGVGLSCESPLPASARISARAQTASFRPHLVPILIVGSFAVRVTSPVVTAIPMPGGRPERTSRMIRGHGDLGGNRRCRSLFECAQRRSRRSEMLKNQPAQGRARSAPRGDGGAVTMEDTRPPAADAASRRRGAEAATLDVEVEGEFVRMRA